jgi:phosphotriesterase-related protein
MEGTDMHDSDLIPSATGDVAADELRWLYPHEHLLISWGEYRGETISSYPGNTEFARRQIAPMLTELKALGVDALIDATPMGIGRDEAYVHFARGLSAASGVRVFLSTGLYATAHWPPWAREWSAMQIADQFTRDLETGIGDTGVRACLLKAAIGTEITAEDEKALTACAIAHGRTGAAVQVHAIGCRKELVGLLSEQGVDPSRIYIAHVDMNTSEEEFVWLAERGVRLVTTNWEFPHHMDQDEARRLLKLLIAAGHLDKILVSIDFCLSIETRWCVGFSTWDNPDRTSYAYLHTGVLPKLRAAGFSEAHLETIMRDNPLEMLRRR